MRNKKAIRNERILNKFYDLLQDMYYSDAFRGYDLCLEHNVDVTTYTSARQMGFIEKIDKGGAYRWKNKNNPPTMDMARILYDDLRRYNKKLRADRTQLEKEKKAIEFLKSTGKYNIQKIKPMRNKEKIENLLAEAMELLLDEMNQLDVEVGEQEDAFEKMKQINEQITNAYNDLTDLK